MLRLKDSASRLIVGALLVIFAASFVGFFPQQTAIFFSRLVLYSIKSYLPVKETVGLEAVNETDLTQALSEPVKKSSKVKAAVKTDKLTKTDSDIEKLIKSAEKSAAKDKKAGSITEYTYTDEGVTDEYKNVRVKNTNKTKISIENKLAEELDLSVNEKEPSVLIYHTHTTETYQILDRGFYSDTFVSRSNDSNKNMVRVGKAICDELEKRGYKVIHDTSVYDNPYTGAYYRSEDAARAILEKHPSIKITLDVHRDAIQSESGVKTKPVAEINGKKAAQIMLVTGCQEEGNGITDLPEWEKNLAFALKLQQSMEDSFEGLTRPVFFCDRSYNMGLTPLSLLVEIGTDGNTLDEAVYSGKMFGAAVAEILDEYKEK